ncbi:threonine synthase [Bullifex porci]|uniref:threonine synthase n=1 Tax=Bullifex porci TaxID=2606638 RepID=UPI0023EFB544|nr:threonine synthase [Bullifex porci]MDD7254495.1 threonine synthase [Bullifex porci]MDY2740491.1 threonine synthase [Bullifex porci]
MYYYSTRDKNRDIKLTASQAILKGLAADGGLFVPSQLPTLSKSVSLELDYPTFAYETLKPFFEGDELLDELLDICKGAFNFPVELRELKDTSVLELFHGPTSAFKDFGARFLSFSMEKLLVKKGEKLCILVATSGDTGGAVASAFHKRQNLSVKVLFPKGRVAERQRRQLTCWDDNISSYEVRGSFDDCQRMVKSAFVDPELKNLSSANSINLGRLLPQMVYYVYASMLYQKRCGKKPVIIVPSGNVGNCTGAFWAKAIGAPIERIVLAVNANTTIPEYLSSGEYRPRDSVKTLANAMDVGAPSNMERLFNLFDSYEKMKENVTAYSVSDEEIKKTIKDEYAKEGYVLCPHTACAERVRLDHFNSEPTIIVSTAHPAKFETVVEPLINKTVEMPPALAKLVNMPSTFTEIGTDYKELFK